MALFLVLFGVGVYFLPTIAAMANHKRNTPGIVLLNLFLGWTLIGWVVALVWAVLKDGPEASDEGDDTKPCPFCAERVKVAASICKHCGRELRAPRVAHGVVLDEGFPSK